MEIRTNAVVFYKEGIQPAKEIEVTYYISEKTARCWVNARQDFGRDDSGISLQQQNQFQRIP